MFKKKHLAVALAFAVSQIGTAEVVKTEDTNDDDKVIAGAIKKIPLEA